MRHAAMHQQLFTSLPGNIAVKRCATFPFAARLLAEWTEERPLLLRPPRHPEVAEHPRQALLAALLLVDRPAAIPWARESLGAAELPALVLRAWSRSEWGLLVSPPRLVGRGALA